MNLIDLLKCHWAEVLDEDGDGRLLVVSDLTGTEQLYEYEPGRAELRQLTDFSEPVRGRLVPGTRKAVAVMDAGGNERHQLYLLDLDDPPGADAGRLEPLTDDPGCVYELIGVTTDGRRIAYVSNKRNRTDFDAYILDLVSREELCVYDGGGWCGTGSGFSPDGRWLSFVRPGPRPLDEDLLVLDTVGGDVRVILPHEDEAALVGSLAWTPGDIVFVSSNVGREMKAVIRYDLASGEHAVAVERPYDLECFSNRAGTLLVVVGNDGGASRAEIFRVSESGSLAAAGDLPLPGQGLILPALLLSDAAVTFTFTSPVVPGDIWRYDVVASGLRRLTSSPGVPADGAPELVEPTVAELTSFDGERLPLFLYRPPSRAGSPAEGGLTPAVLFIHGGPESQSQLMWLPLIQGLVGEGFAVVVPNVRGSTGYGKRYASLDDTTRRLDSVADLAVIHRWLASAGLDSQRAALVGGSYGGYMVLAGCAFQPELWAAGVDIVGISDLVTFLENTSAYRRAHREHEYGSLAEDRAFLEQASPLRHVDAMKAPLFVIHGANDPRVPLSETEQLVASLRERGIETELLVYDDEGHGLHKLVNRLDAYPRAVEFLKGVLRP